MGGPEKIALDRPRGRTQVLQALTSPEQGGLAALIKTGAAHWPRRFFHS